jgi:cbb3-type cytochrome oxidase subunit 3
MALTNIAAAAVASTVAVILIGFAIATVVHFYRKRQKADARREAHRRPPPMHICHEEALRPLPPPPYAICNDGYVADVHYPLPPYGQCIDPPPVYSESNPLEISVVHSDQEPKDEESELQGSPREASS